jgi:hypothetical protein
MLEVPQKFLCTHLSIGHNKIIESYCVCCVLAGSKNCKEQVGDQQEIDFSISSETIRLEIFKIALFYLSISYVSC